MTEPLVPIPLPDLTVIVQPVAAVFAAYGAAKVGPPLIRRARQRAYDGASEAETVRLTISPPPGLDPDAELAVELVRALHPRERRGFDTWRVGWPAIELNVVRRRGELVWEIVANRQVAVLAENAIRSICPGAWSRSGSPLRVLRRPSPSPASPRRAPGRSARPSGRRLGPCTGWRPAWKRHPPTPTSGSESSVVRWRPRTGAKSPRSVRRTRARRWGSLSAP